METALNVLGYIVLTFLSADDFSQRWNYVLSIFLFVLLFTCSFFFFFFFWPMIHPILIFTLFFHKISQTILVSLIFIKIYLASGECVRKEYSRRRTSESSLDDSNEEYPLALFYFYFVRVELSSFFFCFFFSPGKSGAKERSIAGKRDEKWLDTREMFQTNREKRANRAAEINSLKGHAKGNYSFNGDQNVGKNTNRGKVNGRRFERANHTFVILYLLSPVRY